jgi:hypothetical protein
MDFCGVRPANIAKTRARLGHSVAGRSRRAAPGALGAGDRTAHFHIFCGSRSKARAARFPSKPRDRFGGRRGTIKTMPPRRGSATSEFFGRPNLEAARRHQTATQSRWIGPRSGKRTNPTESPPNEGLTLRRGAQSAAPVFDSFHVREARRGASAAANAKIMRTPRPSLRARQRTRPLVVAVRACGCDAKPPNRRPKMLPPPPQI